LYNTAVPVRAIPHTEAAKVASGEWSASSSGCLIPEKKKNSTNWVGGWASLRAGMAISEEKQSLAPIGI